MSAPLCKVIEVSLTDSALSYGGGVDLIDFFVGGYDVDKIKQNIFYDLASFLFYFFFFLMSFGFDIAFSLKLRRLFSQALDTLLFVTPSCIGERYTLSLFIRV